MSQRKRGKVFDSNVDQNGRPPGAGLEDLKEADASKARRRDLRRRELRTEILTGEPDPYIFQRRAVVDDPLLAEALEEAISKGLPAATLADVPRWRREAAVESAISAFYAGRSDKGACQICGSIALTAPRYAERSNIGEPRPVVNHQVRKAEVNRGEVKELTVCGRCAEDISWRTDGAIGLAAAVLSVTAGYAGVLRHRALFAFEAPDKSNGAPWSHVRPSAATGIARKEIREGRALVRNLVTTPERGRALVEQFGLTGSNITAHVWNPANLPKPDPIQLTVSYADLTGKNERKRRDEDRARSEASKAHREEYAATEADNLERLRKFKAKNPPHPTLGYSDPKTVEAWDALIEENRQRLWNVDKKHGVKRPVLPRHLR